MTKEKKILKLLEALEIANEITDAEVDKLLMSLAGKIIGTKGGRKTSSLKKKTSAENGKKGGRPKNVCKD